MATYEPPLESLQTFNSLNFPNDLTPALGGGGGGGGDLNVNLLCNMVYYIISISKLRTPTHRKCFDATIASFTVWYFYNSL